MFFMKSSKHSKWRGYQTITSCLVFTIYTNIGSNTLMSNLFVSSLLLSNLPWKSRLSMYSIKDVKKELCHVRNNGNQKRYYNNFSRAASKKNNLNENIAFSKIKDKLSKIENPKSNKTIKLIQNLLKRKKSRKEQNLTVIEGYRLIIDLMRERNKFKIPHLLVTEDALRHDEFGAELQELLVENYYNKQEEGGEESSSHCQVFLVTNDILQACTDTVTPQGIVATIQIPPTSSSAFSSSSSSQEDSTQNEQRKEPHLILVLDGLSDPGNVGTLLRTSLATGVRNIILLHDTVDPYSPKVIRSSMGAIFNMQQIIECFSFVELQHVLKENFGVDVLYAATMIEESDDHEAVLPSKPYWDIDWINNEEQSYQNVALCIGNEAYGLSNEVRDALLLRKHKTVQVRAVHVPMCGNSIESLNAAVCGSVIIYEFFRQKSLFFENYIVK